MDCKEYRDDYDNDEKLEDAKDSDFDDGNDLFGMKNL